MKTYEEFSWIIRGTMWYQGDEEFRAVDITPTIRRYVPDRTTRQVSMLVSNILKWMVDKELLVRVEGPRKSVKYHKPCRGFMSESWRTMSNSQLGITEVNYSPEWRTWHAG